MRDKIILNDIRIYGHHGCSEEERKIGQHLIIDVELEVNTPNAFQNDKLEDAVDYVQIYKEIEMVVKGESKNLLESLAEDIAQRILENFDKVESIEITLGKNPPPFEGSIGRAAIKIKRSKE